MGALAGTVHGSVLRRREPGQCGDSIDASRAGRITQAARPALRFAQVRTAGFYDDAILPGLRRSILLPALARVRVWVRLLPCGHGKSLDPQW